MGNRNPGKPGRRERSILGPPEGEAWLWLTQSLLESASWRAMTSAARKIVDRLCIEHMAHGGRENGRLAVGYDAFEATGIDRGLIKRTLAELDALGLVKCEQRGRRGWGNGTARLSSYRLTFFGVVGSDDQRPATNEWKAVADDSTAAAAIERARKSTACRRSSMPSSKIL